MRLLIVCGLCCFFIASNHINPTLWPAATAWAARPAKDPSRAPTASTDVVGLAWRESAIESTRVAERELGTQPETIGSIGTEADIPPEPAPVPSRRKVSVAEMCDSIASAAQSNDLPIGFLIRLIWQESGFDSSIVSRAGAQGVAQFMPQTAAEWGLEDPFDPLQALPTSARMLRSLHQQFGNLGLAAAAYNAGSGRIQNWLSKRGKLPDETRSYVMNITGHAAEKWVTAAPRTTNYRIPARAPCQEVAAAADAEMVPLPPVRVAPAAMAYAYALATTPKPGAAKVGVANRKPASIRLASSDPKLKIAAPASIIAQPAQSSGKNQNAPSTTASKTLASKAKPAAAREKRQQSAALGQHGKLKPGKAPVQLAKASASPQKTLSAKPAVKSPKREPLQLAMALRPSVK
jgi:hypothetical protein